MCVSVYRVPLYFSTSSRLGLRPSHETAFTEDHVGQVRGPGESADRGEGERGESAGGTDGGPPPPPIRSPSPAAAKPSTPGRDSAACRPAHTGQALLRVMPLSRCCRARAEFTRCHASPLPKKRQRRRRPWKCVFSFFLFFQFGGGPRQPCLGLGGAHMPWAGKAAPSFVRAGPVVECKPWKQRSGEPLRRARVRSQAVPPLRASSSVRTLPPPRAGGVCGAVVGARKLHPPTHSRP